MDTLTFDSVYFVVGLPAMAIGLLVGLLIMWLVGRGQQTRLQDEREAAFELANAKLTQTFAELSTRSLKANSDNFLLLAEQNLGKQHEKAKRELSEREKAVEALVKPITDALQSSQKQINECHNGAGLSRTRCHNE